MIADRNFGKNGPVTWIGAFPVYVSTILAAIHAVTMVLTALAMAGQAEGVIQAFVFSSTAFLRESALWQVVTYAFVHQPPYWFFLLELYLLVVFGKEVEQHVGRSAFIRLYLTLLLVPPLVLAALGLFGFSSVYAGSSALNFGVFIAFAVLYPRVEMFFGIQTRWIAIGLLAVNGLQCLALGDFVSLSVLLLDSALAAIMVSSMRWNSFFANLPRPARRRPVVVPRETPAKERAVEPAPESIDAILDKISRSGLSSLTGAERDQLERARAALLAKERAN